MIPRRSPAGALRQAVGQAVSYDHAPGNKPVILSSAIDRPFSFLLVGSLLAGSGLASSITLASAADSEPARRHSLIHRQESGSTTIAPESSAPAAPAPAVTSPQPLHRKLTKRPGLATLTAPSNSSSQNVTPAPQGASTLPATKAGSDPQLSMAGT